MSSAHPARPLRGASPLQIPPQVIGAEAVGRGGLACQAAGFHQLGQRLLHGHHAVGATRGELEAQLVVVALADEVADRVGGEKDLQLEIS